MHQPGLLLPGVTALQQGSDGPPEFTYKPGEGENNTPEMSAGQEQSRRFQDQHLEPLTQIIQTDPIHQHSLGGEKKVISKLQIKASFRKKVA